MNSTVLVGITTRRRKIARQRAASPYEPIHRIASGATHHHPGHLMNLECLGHIGVWPPTIGRPIVTYRDLLGAVRMGEPFDLPTKCVKVCFVKTPNTQIALYDDASPIEGFLRKNPSRGQHHVCVEVPDIHAVAPIASRFAGTGVAEDHS